MGSQDQIGNAMAEGQSTVGYTECRAFQSLKTPIWVYQLEPFRLLWANTKALGLGPTATLEAHLSNLNHHNPQGMAVRLAFYKTQLSQGYTIEESQPPFNYGTMPPMGWVGSGFPLADGELGLLVEGHCWGQLSRDSPGSPGADWATAYRTFQHQAETFQAIFDNVPIMLCLLDAQGQVEHINRAMEQGLGWSLAEWQQLNSPEEGYADPDDRQRLLGHICQAEDRWLDLKTGTAQGCMIDAVWTSVQLADGRRIGLGQDIGDRKRTEAQVMQQAQRDRLTAQVTQRISQSLDLQQILDTAVLGLRQILAASRVLVYVLHSSQGGQVAAESVFDQHLSVRGQTIIDHCFSLSSSLVGDYRHGRFQNTPDIYAAGLADCYVKALAEMQVRANLVIPIIQDERLWGLLVCQQCDRPRQWQTAEIDMLTQMASHLAIAIQQSELYQKLQQANQELQHLATHDKLTGLPNRRYFDDYLDQEWRRLTRENAPLGLIFCDIDYFKQYNDAYGHLVGDDCLVLVAQAITRSVKRPADLTARYGGEEFAVILPNTDMAGVIRSAQRIRREIHLANIPHQTSLIRDHITLSMGLACWHPCSTMTPDALKAMADQALYQAKQSGRDRYCLP